MLFLLSCQCGGRNTPTHTSYKIHTPEWFFCHCCSFSLLLYSALLSFPHGLSQLLTRATITWLEPWVEARFAEVHLCLSCLCGIGYSCSFVHGWAAIRQKLPRACRLLWLHLPQVLVVPAILQWVWTLTQAVSPLSSLWIVQSDWRVRSLRKPKPFKHSSTRNCSRTLPVEEVQADAHCSCRVIFAESSTCYQPKPFWFHWLVFCYSVLNLSPVRRLWSTWFRMSYGAHLSPS